MRTASLTVTFALSLLLVSLPLAGDLTLMNLAIKIMIAAIFALGFNLLWGQTGLPSFGHAAYYGVGTFATIYMMTAIDEGGWFPTPLLPLVGAAAGFVFGLVAGWFATIRSGVYFAMITVALAELTSAVAVKWEGLFGGEAGLRSIRTDWGPIGFQSTESVYWLTLAWTLLTMIALFAFQRSPVGLIVRGIRERELRVKFLGYDTHGLKTLVFATSASVSGLAGGLLAISDESASMVLFQGTGSAFVVLNTVLGGAGVFLGPVVGAVITTSFAHYGAQFSHFWMLYLGIAFVAAVMYMPQGIGGAVFQRARAAEAGETPLIGTRDLVRAIAVASASIGTVLLVEMTGTVCSEQYQASVTAANGVWPAISLFGASPDPLSPLPWLTGMLLVAGGIALLFAGGRRKRPPLLDMILTKTETDK